MHLSQDRPMPTRTRRRRWPRLLACLLLIGGQSLLVGGRARAASTGTASLLTPQGSGAVSEDGDYISSNNPTAPATPLDAANIAVMLKSGAEFMANGNVAAARMMLQPAADAGDATAAFALAETYDPMVLARLGVKGGIAPDVALAKRWYAKANALGTSAAQERLVRLTRRSE